VTEKYPQEMKVTEEDRRSEFRPDFLLEKGYTYCFPSVSLKKILDRVLQLAVQIGTAERDRN
jgi:hypothetical protein